MLNLGLLCSYPSPSARPRTRKVVQYLDRGQLIPDMSPTYVSYNMIAMMHNEGSGSYKMACTLSNTSICFVSGESLVAVLQEGRRMLAIESSRASVYSPHKMYKG